MNRDVELHCRCGQVRGRVKGASPSAVNHCVCYCDDCQAFLHYLGRSELLDEHGGTDIVQVAPASLSFEQGTEHIVGLRLTPKGLFRWYASCCKTPLGNTLSPNVPFIGIEAHGFAGPGVTPDEVFGASRGAFLGKFAIGTPPEGSAKLNVRLIARALGKMLGWRVTGKAWPHPYFERASKAPIYPVRVLSRDERAALRPLCGPNPTAKPRTGEALTSES